MSGRLTKSPAKVMQKLLSDLSLASTVESGDSYPCYFSNQPDSPDKCFTTYNTDGRVQGRSMVTGEPLEVHGIQIRLRDTDVEIGDSKMNLVSQTLSQVARQEVDIGSATFLVHAITQQGNLICIGFDAPTTRRTIWTLNLLMTVTQIVSGTG